MFRKILLPVDLSDKHERALSVAVELAVQSGGAVELLHVIEVIAALPREEEREFYGRLEKASRHHLAALARQLEERQVSARQEVRYGHRAVEIARFAQERASDLVVLSCPRPDPANPVASLGSLSHKISLLAPCPVLLVK